MAKATWAKLNVLYFCEPRQCASNGNTFKVGCQDLANRKQDIFRIKTTFILNSWRKQCLTFYNLQLKKLNVQNTELFKTKDFKEKFFHSMDISWISLLPYKLAICGADNQQLKCSSERENSSVPVLKQDLQKNR